MAKQVDVSAQSTILCAAGMRLSLLILRVDNSRDRSEGGGSETWVFLGFAGT